VERELIDLKASHARDVEWDKAIETFRGLLSFDVEAAYTEGSDGSKVWALWGGHAVHMRACEGACRVAAHALENSKLYATLPEHIRAEQDGLSRWLHFVAHRDGWTGFTGEGVDNTQDPPLTTKSKGIKEIALSFKRLCEYCKNSETYL